MNAPMTPRRRSSPLLPLAAALAVLAILAAGFVYLRAQRPAAPAAAGPGIALEGATIGGPFRLTDQNGRTVTDADLRGRYALIYFGYSFCPDICPTDLQRLSQALAAFEREAPALGRRVEPVFVTVDPERDTPAVLSAYAANFHPRLRALTGDAAAIAAAKKAYRVYAVRRADASATDYMMDHSAFTYLFGPDGKPIAGLDSRGSADELRRMLEAYVR